MYKKLNFFMKNIFACTCPLRCTLELLVVRVKVGYMARVPLLYGQGHVPKVASHLQDYGVRCNASYELIYFSFYWFGAVF